VVNDASGTLYSGLFILGTDNQCYEVFKPVLAGATIGWVVDYRSCDACANEGGDICRAKGKK
jgi:hypothetical protein